MASRIEILLNETDRVIRTATIAYQELAQGNERASCNILEVLDKDIMNLLDAFKGHYHGAYPTT